MFIMFLNFGFGYFLIFLMLLWILVDILLKGFLFMFLMMLWFDVGLCEVFLEDVFYCVDLRVFFINYFMNLIKFLKKDEKSFEVSYKDCDCYEILFWEEFDCYFDEEEMIFKEEDENEC